MKLETDKVGEVYFEDFFKSLYSCLQALARLIEKENKFLSHEMTGNLSKILDQKEELLKKIQELEQISANLKGKDEKSSATKQLVDKVTKAQLHLQNVMQANSILLRSNIKVSSKILEMYKAKQLEHAVGQLGYNKDGEMVALKKLEKIMPSISLNNKI